MKRHGSTGSLPRKASTIWLHRRQIARELTLWHTRDLAAQSTGTPDHASGTNCTRNSAKVESSNAKADYKDMAPGKARLTVVAVHPHRRGTIHEVMATGKSVSILLTFHALGRITQWQLVTHDVLQALLFPEEVIRGHRGRFMAHQRSGQHVIRAIYEYDGSLPVVVTVYYPYAERYFQGGGTYEDHILS